MNREKRNDIRRLAMQVLYQMDVRGEADRQTIRENLPEGPDPAAVWQPAFDLAQAAWKRHKEADIAVKGLAPQWPTHRQPPVDRAILRLAYYEMVSGHTPAKVAINEAIELAKQFGSESSPPFVNGVLDKIARQLPAKAPPEEALPQAVPAPDADAWLRDAMRPPEAPPEAPPQPEGQQ